MLDKLGCSQMGFLGRLACKLSQVVRARHVVAKSLPVSFSLKDARGNVIDGRKTTPGDPTSVRYHICSNFDIGFHFMVALYKRHSVSRAG